MKSQIPIPEIITKNLLTGQDGLKPRKNVNCNFIGIYRVYSNYKFEQQEKSLVHHVESDRLNSLILQVNSLQEQLQILMECLKKTEVDLKNIIETEHQLENSLDNRINSLIIQSTNNQFNFLQQQIINLEKVNEQFKDRNKKSSMLITLYLV